MEHLEAAWMALQCRHEATKAWRSAEAVLATASPMKRRRVGGHTWCKVKVGFFCWSQITWRIFSWRCIMNDTVKKGVIGGMFQNVHVLVERMTS